MNKISHPLSELFNIEDSFDEDARDDYAMAEVQSTPVAAPSEAPVDHKDADDILVEQRIDAVYTAALDAFQLQTSYTEIIEPRYAARNAEVAANYLNIALAAANSRAKVKTDRKRSNSAFVPYSNGGKTTNNIVIANREEILKLITIDGETTELK